MGGGSTRGPFTYHKPQELAQLMKRTEDENGAKAFETELSGLLNDLLASANSRDIRLVRDRLEKIKGVLSGKLETSIDSLFGGSVAKHTYVDGLSDIDSLLILNDTELENATPAEAISKVANLIKNSLGSSAKITTGKLAINVEYVDGMAIQLLPAFRLNEGLKVPSFRHDGWSGISPEEFQKVLSIRNEQCAWKLVPTIKLAKAAIGTLPEGQRLTGYHVESLAIEAFREYAGTKTVAAMLPVFFEKARNLVAKPIRDSSGQSVHVDEYLGPEGSNQRIAIGHILERIGKRMRNASAHMSKEQWSSLFESNND